MNYINNSKTQKIRKLINHELNKEKITSRNDL
jgi:hypothetical protein